MGGAINANEYPGGAFIGLNAVIDRKAAEQFILVFKEMAVSGFSKINLCISSTGGELLQAHYMANIAIALGVPVTCYNVGLVASAANILFSIGSERFALPHSSFYFHTTYYNAITQQIDGKYSKATLGRIAADDDASAGIISSRTGIPIKTLTAWALDDTTFNATDAVANGIVHGIKSLSIPLDSMFVQVGV